MSYCVNCGVELAASENKCPLCGVEAVNPRSPWKEPAERPYPNKVDAVMRRADRRLAGGLLLLIFLTPILICSANDYLYNRTLGWSLYVVGAMLLAMVVITLPLFFKKPHPIFFMGIDFLATLLYMLLIETMQRPKKLWFLNLALPIVLVVYALIFLLWLIFRKHKGELMLYIGLSVYVSGILSVVIELLVSAYRSSSALPSWSWYSFIPCAIVGTLFLILNTRKVWREDIRRRFFL